MRAATVCPQFVLAVLVTLTGCSRTYHFGDARVVDNANWPFVTVDWLDLPSFSISNADTTYYWQVRGLPKTVVPDELVIYAQNDDEPGAAPWQTAILDVQMLATDGASLWRDRVTLSKWNGSASHIHRHMEVSYYFDPPFPPLDYDVLVTVVRPSQRAGDKARLHGRFIFKGNPHISIDLQ